MVRGDKVGTKSVNDNDDRFRVGSGYGGGVRYVIGGRDMGDSQAGKEKPLREDVQPNDVKGGDVKQDESSKVGPRKIS